MRVVAVATSPIACFVISLSLRRERPPDRGGRPAVERQRVKKVGARQHYQYLVYSSFSIVVRIRWFGSKCITFFFFLSFLFFLYFVAVIRVLSCEKTTRHIIPYPDQRVFFCVLHVFADKRSVLLSDGIDRSIGLRHVV